MTYAAIYVGVAIAIYAAVLLSLRSEPTAHGQIVGRQMGCLLAVFWLPFLAYLIIASPWIAVQWWQSRDER
jgi:hypothetical protein